ncbi:MAG: hypothetical protein L0Y68_09245 [Candidatus Dadabacteria bacterium]|nr:hypothetical protein [Candidatus Dadabacteria bacterium]
MLGLLCLVISACNNSDNTRPNIQVKWGECPDFIDPDEKGAECTTIDMPLNHLEGINQKIPIFVYRVLGKAPKKKGQIWFLQGGPGDTNAVFAQLFFLITDRFPEWDFYSPEHRGVGLSANLNCNDQPLQDPDYLQWCIDFLEDTWGDNLKDFSTTNAAFDVINLIDILREKDKQVFIYGGSYGTYWIQRMLQIDPNIANGVILDSICPASDCFLDNFDANQNFMGMQIMEICNEDVVCSEKLRTIDADAWQAVGKVFQKVDEGIICAGCNSDECMNIKETFDRETLRNILAVMAGDWCFRPIIPPLIYRLNRCNGSDQIALNNFLQSLSGGNDENNGDSGPELDSQALSDHISLSELFMGISLEKAEAVANSAFFSDDTSLGLAEINNTGEWPVYGKDDFIGGVPDTDIPVLMLNSTIDGATPLSVAEQAKSFFNKDHQSFIPVPFASHGVIFTSYTTDIVKTGVACVVPTPPNWTTCGLEMMFDFIEGPTEELNTSCLNNIYKLEFSGTSEITRILSQINFGTDDMWE